MIVAKKYGTAKVHVSEHHENERLQKCHKGQQGKRDHRQNPRSQHQDDHQEHIITLDVTEQSETK